MIFLCLSGILLDPPIPGPQKLEERQQKGPLPVRAAVLSCACGEGIRTPDTRIMIPLLSTPGERAERVSTHALTARDSSESVERLGVLLGVLKEKDPDLASVLESWPTLPEPMRPGIVAMVKAARRPP